jgi:hypothetical protein
VRVPTGFWANAETTTNEKTNAINNFLMFIIKVFIL